MRTRPIPMALVFALLALPIAACGDDDDGDASAAGVERYCELQIALNEQETPPSAEQLDELIAAAPDEIKEDTRFFADAVAKGPAAYEDPKVQEAEQRLVAFDERECGIEAKP